MEDIMKANVRVSGIIFKEVKVALVKHENKHNGIYYLLPGGGLDVKINFLAYYEDVVSEDDHTLHLIFGCETIGGKVENLDLDKKVKDIVFMNEEEFKKVKFFPEKLKKTLFVEKDNDLPISLGKTPFP